MAVAIGTVVVVEPRKLFAHDADCQTTTLLALPSVGSFRDGLSVPARRRRAALSGPDGRCVGVAFPATLPTAWGRRSRDRIPLCRGDPPRERGDAAQAGVRSGRAADRCADLRRRPDGDG